MKQLSFLFVFALTTFSFVPGARAQAIVYTQQEIRYTAEGAGEVYLVWGINNWQHIPANQWPAGTFVKKSLLYTPMQKKDSWFSASLRLPQNTTLDYVFWISKSYRNKSADVWDINTPPFRDYHSLATQNNTILISSTMRIKPGEPLSILDFAVPVFLISVILFCFFTGLKKLRKEPLIKSNPVKMMVCGALVLFAGLLLSRPSVAGTSWDIYAHPVNNISLLLAPAIYDFAFVLILTVMFLIPVMLAYKYPAARKIIAGFYLFICVVLFPAGLLNIRIVEILGKPFTYKWLYYSDFLRGPDSHSAVSANVSLMYIVNVLFLWSSAILVWLMAAGTNITISLKKPVKILGGLGLSGLCIVYFLFSYSFIREHKLDYNQLSNPVTAFLESVNPLSAKPSLFTMQVQENFSFHPGSGNASPAQSPLGAIKKVIIFVLESTPAEYISAYNSKYNVTPELDKFLNHSLIFENIYAHAPATNNSMVSLLASSYPSLSYVTLTQEHPEAEMATLSSELKKKGYHTAFFNSADNRFQRADEFLSYRRFDTITDCRQQECGRKQFLTEDNRWKYLNGKDDGCTEEAMSSWISARKNTSFLAVLWTYQTHYPYFSTGTEIVYDSSDPVFNRYLNAVHHSDMVFGEMMEMLKKDSILDSTLIVLTGDHGEAFGRHHQTTHASGIYEENLHVPCIFINPSFESKKYDGIGGLVDIAPTVMNLLQYTAPANWQGKSLFMAKHDDRVFFFSPWADYLFGYREGDFKYIFNATRNTTEVYNLTKDPNEETNLAASEGARIADCHQRLAGWVQYVNRMMAGLFKNN